MEPTNHRGIRIITFFCFLLFPGLLLQAQGSRKELQFPQSFRLNAGLLPGLVIVPVNGEMKKTGIIDNPGATMDKTTIRRMCKDCDPDDVNNVYYEIYHSRSNDHDDAGVVVTQFHSRKLLEKNLADLHGQSNLAFLTVGKYLIMVWSDVSRDRERILASLSGFYRRSLGATVYKAKEEEPEMTADAVDTTALVATAAVMEAASAAEDAAMAATEAATASDATGAEAPAAVAGSAAGEADAAAPDLTQYYAIGFGSVKDGILSQEELQDIRQRVDGLYDTYKMEVAIETIGTSDIATGTPAMMAGYAAHLVGRNEARIRKNIVLLLDEVHGKAWIFAGKENGKYMDAGQVQKMSSMLGAKLKQGKTYDGLKETLQQIRAALENQASSK